MFNYENDDTNPVDLRQENNLIAGNNGYEIGKGWPKFSISELEKIRGLDGQEYGFNPYTKEMAGAAKEVHEKIVTIELAGAAADEVVTNNVSILQVERAHMSCLSGELCKKIMPFIREVLKDYDETSSIFGEDLDMALLCEVIDKSMQLTALAISDVKEIMFEAKGGAWDRRDLLYCVFEEVALKEIFAQRSQYHS